MIVWCGISLADHDEPGFPDTVRFDVSLLIIDRSVTPNVTDSISVIMRVDSTQNAGQISTQLQAQIEAHVSAAYPQCVAAGKRGFYIFNLPSNLVKRVYT